MSDPGMLKNSFLHFVLREVQYRLTRSYSNTPVGVTITLEERVRAVAAQQRVTDQDVLNASMVIKKDFEERAVAMKKEFDQKLAAAEKKAIIYESELTTTKEDLAKTNQKFSEMEESMKTVQATLLVLASQGKLNTRQTETSPTVYSPGLFGASIQGSASSDAENIPSLIT